jgi:hypothetical protein
MFIHPSNYIPFAVSYLGFNISHPLSIFVGRYHPLSLHPLRCIIFPRNLYKMVLWIWTLDNLTARHVSRNERTSKRGQPALTCSRTLRARDIADIFKILFGNCVLRMEILELPLTNRPNSLAYHNSYETSVCCGLLTDGNSVRRTSEKTCIYLTSAGVS